MLRTFRKRRQSRFVPKSHGDLWSVVKSAQRSRPLSLHKIKSHLSESTFQAQYEQSLWWMWLGNVEADDLAGQRAASLFIPEAERALKWLDARTWKVQTRLLDVLEWWVTRPQFAPPKISTCTPPTKKQWFQVLLTDPNALEHQWAEHKRGLKRRLCAARLVSGRRWFDLRAVAGCPCPGRHYLEHTKIVHFTHVLEGKSSGKVACRVCGSSSFLFKLPKSQLTSPCKRYPRSG